MSLCKRQPRLLSTNLTVNDCGRSQSSKSSLSDLNWSECNTANRQSVQQNCEQDSTALLEDYNGVFVLISGLKAAIDTLVAKVDRVVGTQCKGDTVHGRLFDMLSEKIKDLNKSVKKTRIARIAGSSSANRRPSVSVFSPREPKSSRTIATAVKTSMTSLRIIHRESDTQQANADLGFSAVKKRKTCLSAKSDTNQLSVSSPVVALPALTKPVSQAAFSSELLSAKCCKTQESTSDRKMNFFDIILNLNRMNFIDHEQVIILKKCVIRKDERVLKPLRSYEANKDLQVLIGSIGTIIESCELDV